MFALTQIIHFLINPLHILFLMLGAACVLHRVGTPRSKAIARLGFVLSACWMVLIMTPFLPHLAASVLENRFPANPDHPPPDAIVILGGWQDNAGIIRDRRQIAVNGAAERLILGLEVARRFPDAGLYLAGGLKRFADAPSEGETSLDALKRLGHDPERAIIEGRSRNTFENARELAEGYELKDGRPVWLVTSAIHMPRAMAVFRKAGINAYAYPVDYHTPRSPRTLRWDAVGNVWLLQIAMREWVGLVFYRLAGRSDSIFGSMNP